MTKTLLVDGNNLMKIGFHGVKDYYHNGNHIGGIWHFLNTTRRFIEEVFMYGTNQAKWKAADEFCIDRGMKFLVLTENDLGITP